MFKRLLENTQTRIRWRNQGKGLGIVTLLTNIFLTSRLPKYFFKTVCVHREYQNNMYSQISLCIFGQIIIEDVFFVFLAIFLI